MSGNFDKFLFIVANHLSFRNDVKWHKIILRGEEDEKRKYDLI